MARINKLSRDKRKKIEEFLWKNDRVVDIEWNEFSEEESILFIKLC